MSSTEIAVGIAVICAIAGLILAPHRYRTPVEGFLLGGLFGPIGLLVILLWPGKKPDVAEAVIPPAARTRY